MSEMDRKEDFMGLRNIRAALQQTASSALVLTGLALPLFVFFPGSTTAMNGTAVPGGESWLAPRPLAGDYPAELKPVVESLNAAFSKTQADALDQGASKFEETLRQLDALEPKLPRGAKDEAYTLRGLALEKLGRHPQALEAYDQSLDLRAGNPFGIFRRALVLAALTRHTEAVLGFKEVLWRSTSHQNEVLYAMAESLNALGDTTQSAAALERAYAVDPNYLPVSRLLVQTRLKQLENAPDPAARKVLEAQALTSLQLITANAPDDEQSGYLLARLLLSQGNMLVAPDKLAQAEALAQRLVASSAYGNDTYARLLFDTQLKLGKADAAQETLRRALERSPRSAVITEAQKQLEIERAAAASPLKTE